MISERFIEFCVGLFLFAALLALFALAFKVSGLTSFFHTDGYDITAQFDNIGQLKVRSAVKIGGVNIGEVKNIFLDDKNYKATVRMHINASIKDIPDDSSAAILTAGLLGDNYIAITPMYSTIFLKNGGQINDTKSALILENLIGQLIFKIGNQNTSTNSTNKEINTSQI